MPSFGGGGGGGTPVLAHLVKVLRDDQGRLVLGTTVRILEPDSTTLISETMYSDDAGLDAMQNPFICDSGVIDFYLTDPKRVRIGITSSLGGAERYYDSIDVILPEDLGGGFSAEGTGTNSTTVSGTDASSSATATGSTSYGYAADATAAGATALGSGSEADGVGSVALGDAEALGDQDIAIGDSANTTAGGTSNIVLGYGASAVGTGSGVVPTNRSIALGANAQVTDDDTMVLKINFIDVQPSTTNHATTIRLHKTGGGSHIVGVTDAGLTFDGSPLAAGASSTNGYGLPSPSGYHEGDLFFERFAQREYTIVGGVWQSAAGSVNSTGTGLPAFVGRAPGDHAFEDGAGRDYVLTGVPGSETYVSPAVVGTLYDVGTADASVEAVANFTASNGDIAFRMGGTNPSGTGGDVVFFNRSFGAYTINMPGTGSVTVGGFDGADISVAKKGGVLLAYINGALAATGTTSAVGHYFGIETTTAVTTPYFAARSSGTLAWTVGQPTREGVNTVATSGSAQTLADPDVQSISRITLSANCLVTAPTPHAGQSMTISLVQDGTGGHAVTWSSNVDWGDAGAPTVGTTAGKATVVSLICDSDTSGVWMAFLGGTGF